MQEILLGGDLALDFYARYPVVYQLVALAGLLGVAWLLHLALRRFIVGAIDRFVSASSATWDDALQQQKVFDHVAVIVPIVVIWYGASLIPHLHDNLRALLARVALAWIVLMGARVIGGLLDATHIIYSANPETGRRSIKGYLNFVQLVVYLVSAIVVFAVLLDRSPLVFLGGLGAMTAVLLLVFKDTLLGLVASWQIAANEMVRIGDWIEMPQSGVDGDVIDIALHTVKVQNFDKTISTVPTQKLIQESFKNWRGMSQAGGRRIKRCIGFDLNTVRFLSADEVESFSRYALLREYIATKRNDLSEFNSSDERNPQINADIRRLTNIGTLRAYIESYLRNHEKIHQNMTLLVRQLESIGDGLPIQIYCFTNTTNWGAYERIQADIFDHILAIAPEFGLRVFQNVSDFQNARRGDTDNGRAPLIPAG